MLNTYQPSGKFESSSLPALLSASFAGILGVSFVVGYLSQWFDLIILFPIGMGILTGLTVKFGAKLGHCRSQAIIIAMAVLAGSLTYVGKLYVNYRVHRSKALVSIQEELTKGGGGSTTPDDVFDNLFLKTKTGSTGFVGYTKIILQDGISITSSHGRSGGGLNLGYTGSLVLLLIEAGLCIYFCFLIARAQLDEPYCESCFRWIDPSWTRNTGPGTLPEMLKTLADITTEHPLPTGFLANLPTVPEVGEFGKIVLKQCPGCKVGYLTISLLTPSADQKQVNEAFLVKNGMLAPDSIATALAEIPPEQGI